MNFNISDWMNDLDPGEFEDIQLSDPQITTPERILSMVTQTPQPEKRPARRLWRTLLIAAALVAALSATALAAYQYGVWDAILPATVSDTAADSTQPETHTLADGTQAYALSSNGYRDSPEYQAYAAWQTYLTQWEEENPNWFAENGLDDSQYETARNYAYYYEAYATEQAQKLDEIVAQYGLTLHTAQVFYDGQTQLCSLLGIEQPLLPEDSYTRVGGYIYDDGSFKAEGYLTWPELGEEKVGFSLFSAVHGSFTMISSAVRDEYESWDYVTADGVSVVLILSEDYGDVIANMDSTYVTAHFDSHSCDQNLQESQDAVVNREILEQLADGLGLARLDALAADETVAQTVAENVTAALQQEQAEVQSQQVFASIGDKVAAVQAVMGEYHLSVPDYDWLYIRAFHPAADGTYTVSEDGTAMQYYDIWEVYRLSGVSHDVSAPYITFVYERYFDMDGAEDMTAQAFENDWEIARQNTRLSYSDCTVHGYSGYAEEGTDAIYVHWLDTERDLIYFITYEYLTEFIDGRTVEEIPGARMTLEDVLALAESFYE
jgi:hypothetical protein